MVSLFSTHKLTKLIFNAEMSLKKSLLQNDNHSAKSRKYKFSS